MSTTPSLSPSQQARADRPDDATFQAGIDMRTQVMGAEFVDRGFGNATDAGEWSYANLDITIQFLRMPVGDWFLLDAETHMAGNGHGTARNVFADEQGVYARGFQTIFVAPGHLSKSVPKPPG